MFGGSLFSISRAKTGCPRHQIPEPLHSAQLRPAPLLRKDLDSLPAGKLFSPEEFIFANLVYRDGGAADELLEIYRPVLDYAQSAIDTASYTMGSYETEYIPQLIRFMCNAWHALRQKGCTLGEDLEICLSTIVRALKFVNGF